MFGHTQRFAVLIVIAESVEPKSMSLEARVFKDIFIPKPTATSVTKPQKRQGQ
jgi:hypothetical protein